MAIGGQGYGWRRGLGLILGVAVFIGVAALPLFAQVEFDRSLLLRPESSIAKKANDDTMSSDDSMASDPADSTDNRIPLLSERGKRIEEKTWDGFVTGLRGGFEKMPRPIDVPLYFEDPYINTDFRAFVMYHEFPKSSVLNGGDLYVQAVQARLALTERLQFIATADGYTDLETGALPRGDGWNDLAVGLKYAFYVDHETMTIVSGGVRWRLSNGSRDVVQGIEDEVSVFVTGAKKYDKLNVISDLVGRFTTGREGNDIVQWDVNASYELSPGFFPTLEYHGLHYLSNGKRPGFNAVRDGLLDYGNLGSGEVAGSSANWATVGLHWEFMPDVALRAGYSFGLWANSDNDIFEERVIVGLNFTF